MQPCMYDIACKCKPWNCWKSWKDKVKLPAKLNKHIKNHEKISKNAKKETEINKKNDKNKNEHKHALGMNNVHSTSRDPWILDPLRGADRGMFNEATSVASDKLTYEGASDK
jgi:hypothetical protein